MRVLLALLLAPSLALAAEPGATGSAGASGDPMAGWVPPKVKNEAKDKQEIQAVFRASEAAMRSGDLEAAAALVDFPVMMMTDDSKGQAMGEAWSREQWIEVMRPFYEKPMKDVKVTHKPNIFLLTDSLASVDDVVTMTQGGKTVTSRNSAFFVRRDGRWRMKAMAEGGWGDMMASPGPGTASGAQGAQTGSTGAGGQGQGAQSATPGGVTEPPGAAKTGDPK